MSSTHPRYGHAGQAGRLPSDERDPQKGVSRPCDIFALVCVW